MITLRGLGVCQGIVLPGPQWITIGKSSAKGRSHMIHGSKHVVMMN